MKSQNRVNRVSNACQRNIICFSFFLFLLADRYRRVDTRNVVHHIRHGRRWLARNHKKWEPVFASDSTVCHASNRTTTVSTNQSPTTWKIQLLQTIVLLNEALRLAPAAVSPPPPPMEPTTTIIVRRKKTVRIPMKSTKNYFARTSSHRIVRKRMKLYCRHRAPVHTLAQKRATHWNHRLMSKLSQPMATNSNR